MPCGTSRRTAAGANADASRLRDEQCPPGEARIHGGTLRPGLQAPNFPWITSLATDMPHACSGASACWRERGLQA
jgi:hypothetical protein